MLHACTKPEIELFAIYAHTYMFSIPTQQGAKMVPLRTASEVVGMAAAVETRLCRGTRMNDTSSRSHCVALFTLYMLKDDAVRLRNFPRVGLVRQSVSHSLTHSTTHSLTYSLNRMFDPGAHEQTHVLRPHGQRAIQRR